MSYSKWWNSKEWRIPKKKILENKKCPVLNCKNQATVQHHITYDPEDREAIEKLCYEHHRQITAKNCQEARKIKNILSNNQRWIIYENFIHGKYGKIRITKIDEKWMNNTKCELKLNKISNIKNNDSNILTSFWEI